MKLDSLYNFKVSDNFGEDYFENQLRIFKRSYIIDTNNISPKNLETIKRLDLSIKKIIQFDADYGDILITRSQTNDNLQSINGHPAVKIRNRTNSRDYYFIKNQIICSSNFPGLIRYSEFVQERLFFKIHNDKAYVFKYIVIFGDKPNHYRVHYYNYDGNSSDYLDKPATATVNGEIISESYNKNPLGYQYTIKNKITMNYLKYDHDRNIVEFNGKIIPSEKFTHKFQDISDFDDKLVKEPKKYINPNEYFP